MGAPMATCAPCLGLHRQGYNGVECSVRVAAALNAPAGEFAGLLNVRACNSSTSFHVSWTLELRTDAGLWWSA